MEVSLSKNVQMTVPFFEVYEINSEILIFHILVPRLGYLS